MTLLSIPNLFAEVEEKFHVLKNRMIKEYDQLANVELQSLREENQRLSLAATQNFVQFRETQDRFDYATSKLGELERAFKYLQNERNELDAELQALKKSKLEQSRTTAELESLLQEEAARLGIVLSTDAQLTVRLKRVFDAMHDRQPASV